MTTRTRIMACVLILVPLVLFILPADYFDTGETICISRRFFNVECYGCGMTRAVMHMIHLEFDTAWHFNKLVVIVLPLLGLLWLKLLLRQFGIEILWRF